MTSSAIDEREPARASATGSASARSRPTLAEPVAPGAPRQGKATLGQQLVGADIITSEQLDQALAEGSQKGLRLGEVLVEMGMVQEDAILPFIEGHLGVPATRLRDGMIDPVAVRLLPKRVAERLDAIALFKVRDTICVAMADPQNLEHLDEIERITSLHVRPVFAFRSSIQRTLPRCYEEGFEVDTVTADLDESAVQLQADAAEVDLTNVESMVDGSPIINLVNYLLVQAIRAGASDIHIEPSRKFSVVRFRVDGQMYEALRPRRDMHPALVSRIKVMGKMDIAEHNRPQDGRFQVTVEGREVDFRISTLPTVLGEKIVMRILDKENLTFSLDLLGFPPDMLKQLKLLLAKPYGLMLVTGPTGSGKTTTLYSALELIKSVHSNVVSVEDPVEYQVELVNQVQVDESRQLSFSSALRSILRQDPDIIMIGEIRDVATAQIAVQAALTGHLVLSTLHTNDCAGAIHRLVDMGIEPFKIAAALVGVVAQRLIRTVCQSCKTFVYASAELLETIHYQGDKRKSFIRGEGCPKCHDTGYIGRTGIYEVMTIDREIRELISKASGTDEIRDCYRRAGGRTLLEQGIRLAEKELTSLEEVMRVAYFE
jgi:type IV pilus assembly protein PilB